MAAHSDAFLPAPSEALAAALHAPYCVSGPTLRHAFLTLLGLQVPQHVWCTCKLIHRSGSNKYFVLENSVETVHSRSERTNRARQSQRPMRSARLNAKKRRDFVLQKIMRSFDMMYAPHRSVLINN